MSKPSRQCSTCVSGRPPPLLLHHFCLAAAAGPTSGLAFSPLQAPGQGRLGHWLLKYAQLQLSLSCSPRSQLSHSEPQSNLCPKFAIVSLRLTFWFMNKEQFLYISHWLVCDDVMWTLSNTPAPTWLGQRRYLGCWWMRLNIQTGSNQDKSSEIISSSVWRLAR